MRSMLGLRFPPAVTVAVLIIVFAILCIVIYSLSSDAEHSLRGAANNFWVSPVDDLTTAKGPVTAVLIVAAEPATDGSQTEIARRPLMEFQYDASGRIVRRIDHGGDSSRPSTRTYVYDDKGRLVKENYLSAVDGRVYLETIYTYDAQGRPSEAVSYDTQSGSLLSKEIYSHGPAEDYTEVAESWGETLRAKAGYFRDAHGRIAESHQLSTMFQGKAVPGYAGKTVYTYSEKGNVIQALYFNAEGKLEMKESIGYEYDSHGNWIKRIVTADHPDGGMSSESIRDITYRTITYNQ